MSDYTYIITPRAQHLGGGWRLQLLEDQQEAGGGIYPLAEGETSDDAYQDALADGEAWLLSRGEAGRAGTAAALPDWIDYDPPTDVLQIHGYKYSGELFRGLGLGLRIGEWFRVVDRANNVLSIERLAAESAKQGAQPEQAEPSTLDRIGDLFGIGALARSEGTILANVRNTIRRAECLSAIEHAFFMEPAEPDEDFPDEDPGEECMLGWGRDPQQYVEQFRAALTKIAAPAAQVQADVRDQASVEQATGAKEGAEITDAARDVLAERRRQMEQEGWTPAHDDEHGDGSMADAAGCYAAFAYSWSGLGRPPSLWPWAPVWWKPGNPRCNLVKAGALILAEIERVDRLAKVIQQDESERIDRASTASAEGGEKGGA